MSNVTTADQESPLHWYQGRSSRSDASWMLHGSGSQRLASCFEYFVQTVGGGNVIVNSAWATESDFHFVRIFPIGAIRGLHTFGAWTPNEDRVRASCTSRKILCAMSNNFKLNASPLAAHTQTLTDIQETPLPHPPLPCVVLSRAVFMVHASHSPSLIRALGNHGLPEPPNNTE